MVMEACDTDRESIVGDECHIVSTQKNGPRYREDYLVGEHDSPKNIILLCKVHHKQVDDQVEYFNESLLQKIKNDHEKWVHEKLSESDISKPIKICRIKKNIPSHLYRISNGKELLSLALNACAAYYDYDDLSSDGIEDLVANFYQNLQDWVDVGIDEIGQRIEAEKILTKQIQELKDSGYWVFGAREQQILEGGSGQDKGWPVLHLRIIRKDSDAILKTQE
jgi:hypothetical protein